MRYAEIYCEGYHDRAFLAGWLEARGWTDPGRQHKRRIPVRNPVTKKGVTGGRFAFRFADVMFLEIIPAGGKEDAIVYACRSLRNSLTEEAPPASILIACDLDEEEIEGCRRRLAKRFEAARRTPHPIGTAALIWHAAGDFGPGVPAKQTLERLVCGALSAAHEARGRLVEEWLVATGNSDPSPKSYSWSHMAGWYAKHGCEDFFRQMWREEAVRDELRGLLDPCGARALAALEAKELADPA